MHKMLELLMQLVCDLLWGNYLSSKSLLKSTCHWYLYWFSLQDNTDFHVFKTKLRCKDRDYSVGGNLENLCRGIEANVNKINKLPPSFTLPYCIVTLY